MTLAQKDSDSIQSVEFLPTKIGHDAPAEIQASAPRPTFLLGVSSRSGSSEGGGELDGATRDAVAEGSDGSHRSTATRVGEAVDTLARFGIERHYPKGSVVINEGDIGDSMFVIRSGRVKVFAGEETGKEVIISVLGAGDYFGELSIFDRGPRAASVATLAPTVVSMISRANFERCMRQHADLSEALIRLTVRRIRNLIENVKTLALLDVYGRVARVLSLYAMECDGERIVCEALTHQSIANIVGASREMVSRIMKDLERGKYIRREGNRLIIDRRLPKAW